MLLSAVSAILFLGSEFGFSKKLDPDPDSGTGTVREHRRRRELSRKSKVYTVYWVHRAGRRENQSLGRD